MRGRGGGSAAEQVCVSYCGREVCMRGRGDGSAAEQV